MDPASAGAAAAELRKAAERLGQLTEARTVRARDATDGWDGPARQHFDERLPRVQTQADELIVALRRAAAQIDHALQDAYREQRRRVLLREERRRERRPNPQVR